MIDVNMPFSYISMKLIGELDMLEPFGANNKKPVFAEKIQRIERFRVFGKNNNVITETLSMDHINEFRKFVLNEIGSSDLVLEELDIING